MDIALTTKHVKAALTNLARVKGSQHHHGTDGVMISATRRGVALTTLGGHLWDAARVRLAGAVVHGYGYAIVEQPVLKDIIGTLPGDTVSIRLAEDGVQIRSGDADITLSTLPDLSYRDFTVPELVLRNNPTDLSDAVARLVSASTVASGDTARPVLTGVHFTPGFIEATDSYKLVRYDFEHELEVNVPGRAFKLAGQAKVTELAMVVHTIDVSHHTAMLRGETAFGTVIWAIPTIEGRYPNVAQLLPDRDSSSIVSKVERAVLDRKVERLAKITGRSHTIAPITAAFGSNGIMLSVSTSKSKAKELVPAVTVGELTAAYNPAYLCQVLAAATEDTVEIGLRDEMKPALVRSAGYTGLVMPVRI